MLIRCKTLKEISYRELYRRYIVPLRRDTDYGFCDKINSNKMFRFKYFSHVPLSFVE